jgi:hypothetical protein
MARNVKWGQKGAVSCKVTAGRTVNLESTTGLYSSRYRTQYTVTNGSVRRHHIREHGLLVGYKSLCAE